MEITDLRELFDPCFAMQDEMNKIVLGDDWPVYRKNWALASSMEAMEFIDHIGWKWWKISQPDYRQAYVELVDILHFVLSDMLEKQFFLGGNLWAENEWVYWRDPSLHGCKSPINTPEGEFAACVSDEDLVSIAYAFAAACKSAPPTKSLVQLMNLTENFGVSIGELAKDYAKKNALNIVRQRNGYRDGTYQKIWNGREDNEVVSDLLSGDAVPAGAMVCLVQQEYDKVLKSE